MTSGKTPQKVQKVMSHLIVKPYDMVYCPELGEYNSTWHGLETKCQGGIALDGSNIQRALRPIVQSGLKPDFSADVCTLSAEDAADLGGDCLKEFKLILADLRQDGHGAMPLHVPKKGYVIHQNLDLFNSAIAGLRKVVGDTGFEIATVGTLGAYSQFFISVALKGMDKDEVKPGDVHASFLNFISSHNSLTASARLMSSIRAVCMNTVQASLADADNTGYKSVIKHTLNSGEHISADAVETDVKNWLKTKERHLAIMRHAASVKMTVDSFRAFAAGVFTNEGSDDLSTQSFNRVEAMTPIFQHGRGNSGVSLYDGLNAFTEFFTSGGGVGGSNVRLSKRIASANFGRGNEWKLEAIRVASSEETLTETMARGERFYADKAKEMVGAN